VFTEVILAHDSPHIFNTLGKYFNDVLGAPLGFESRNICRLLKFIEKHGLEVPYVMTPLNSVGYQMTPNRIEAEKCIERLSRFSKVIAVNILASGALSLSEALEYVKKFNVYAVAVGTSKPWRAREIFSRLKNVLKTS